MINSITMARTLGTMPQDVSIHQMIDVALYFIDLEKMDEGELQILLFTVATHWAARRVAIATDRVLALSRNDGSDGAEGAQTKWL